MGAGSFNLTVFWHAASVLVLVWLAVFFGKTLLPGRVPLIEQIARVDDPDMPESLRRYTRGLTAIWCCHFVAATGCVVWLSADVPYAGALVWPGSVVLFVGERWLRPLFFPGRSFPGLLRQVMATRSIWTSSKPTRE